MEMERTVKTEPDLSDSDSEISSNGDDSGYDSSPDGLSRYFCFEQALEDNQIYSHQRIYLMKWLIDALQSNQLKHPHLPLPPPPPYPYEGMMGMGMPFQPYHRNHNLMDIGVYHDHVDLYKTQLSDGLRFYPYRRGINPPAVEQVDRGSPRITWDFLSLMDPAGPATPDSVPVLRFPKPEVDDGYGAQAPGRAGQMKNKPVDDLDLDLKL